MGELNPILVADLFPELLAALVNLLDSLSPQEWTRPTTCAGWTVHDVGLHLLGDDMGILSRGRDGYTDVNVDLASWDEIVAWLNERNARWVENARRISPRLLRDLLQWTGQQVNAYFLSLDPYALGGPVSWAGPEPAPVWLDLAREFTERWHHQQHIRDAVGAPGLFVPRYLAPVLATFVYALPQAYRTVEAEDGTAVTLTIIGDSGGSWTVVCNGGRWRLEAGRATNARAEVALPEDTAWRLFTKGIDKETAHHAATVQGDSALADKMLDAVSIIA